MDSKGKVRLDGISQLVMSEMGELIVFQHGECAVSHCLSMP